jgi:hypothetical protein
LGGTQEIYDAVLEDLLGGTGKAEAAKLPGAGIIPKQCPMKRVGTEAMHRDYLHRYQRGPEAQGKNEKSRADFAAAGEKGAKKNGTNT